MLSDEMTTGSVTTSDAEKRVYAARSHTWNLGQRRFKEAFPDVSTVFHLLNPLYQIEGGPLPPRFHNLQRIRGGPCPILRPNIILFTEPEQIGSSEPK